MGRGGGGGDGGVLGTISDDGGFPLTIGSTIVVSTRHDGSGEDIYLSVKHPGEGMGRRKESSHRPQGCRRGRRHLPSESTVVTR